jgi:hypothetical protein
MRTRKMFARAAGLLLALGGLYACSSTETEEAPSDGGRDAAMGGHAGGSGSGGTGGGATGGSGGGTGGASSDASSDATDESTDAEMIDGNGDAVSEETGPSCAATCGSGACDSLGNCTPCLTDGECTGGTVCGTGVCAAPCDGDAGTCGGGRTCCAGHCVNTSVDPLHCGGAGTCGTACTLDQFCATGGTAACKDAVVANICDNAKITFVQGIFAADNDQSAALRTALEAKCAGPSYSAASQDVAHVNPTTGQPFAGGGELLVAVGGDTGERLVAFLETHKIGSVYNMAEGANVAFKKRAGEAGADTSIVSIPSTEQATHDAFVVEVIRDPVSGTLAFVIYGFAQQGTEAGVLYFVNQLLPNLSTLTKSWYVYEWKDLNAVGPGVDDEFTLKDSGP